MDEAELQLCHHPSRKNMTRTFGEAPSVSSQIKMNKPTTCHSSYCHPCCSFQGGADSIYLPQCPPGCRMDSPVHTRFSRSTSCSFTKGGNHQSHDRASCRSKQDASNFTTRCSQNSGSNDRTIYELNLWKIANRQRRCP